MSNGVISVPRKGFRVWTIDGYEKHGPPEGPKVDVPRNTGGTIIGSEPFGPSPNQTLYQVKWDSGQTTRHLENGFVCLGPFATLDEWVKAIVSSKDMPDMVVDGRGDFVEFIMFVAYMGHLYKIHLTSERGWIFRQAIEPVFLAMGRTIRRSTAGPRADDTSSTRFGAAALRTPVPVRNGSATAPATPLPTRTPISAPSTAGIGIRPVAPYATPVPLRPGAVPPSTPNPAAPGQKPSSNRYSIAFRQAFPAAAAAPAEPLRPQPISEAGELARRRMMTPPTEVAVTPRQPVAQDASNDPPSSHRRRLIDQDASMPPRISQDSVPLPSMGPDGDVAPATERFAVAPDSASTTRRKRFDVA